MSEKTIHPVDYFSIIAPVVDTQPAWNLMVAFGHMDETTPQEMRDFTRFKLKESIARMRDAARELDKRLKEIDANFEERTKKGKK